MAEPTNIEEDARHVLIVDDDDRIRTLLKKYLSENGYRTSVAQNAAEARRVMSVVDFDALVVDVMMPGESGFDFTKSVRSASNVPILLLTARGLPEDRIEGLERGADDYLSKPFEPRELLLRINALLRRARPRRSQQAGTDLWRLHIRSWPGRIEARRRTREVDRGRDQPAQGAGEKAGGSDFTPRPGGTDRYRNGAFGGRSGNPPSQKDRRRPARADLPSDCARRWLRFDGGLTPCFADTRQKASISAFF